MPATSAGPASAAPAADTAAPSGSWRRYRVDAAVCLALALAVFVVHDAGYALSAPFWNDEAWVAISTKLPLHDLPRDTASTPLGWALLLRLMVIGGDQRYRLVPLAFAAVAPVAGYALARTLPWASRGFATLAGAFVGLFALMLPSILIRNDLKQYTADVAFSLALLCLLSRLEQRWSLRRLGALTAVCVVGFLFSAAACFVGIAALFSYALACLFARRWRQLGVVTAVAGGAAIGLGGIYLLTYRPGVPKGLGQYWKGFYLPVDKGWGASLSYLWMRARELAPYTGVPNAVVVLALFVLGVLTLVRIHRPAVGMTVPILLAEMIALGAFKDYPLLDERTSTFLLVCMASVAAIGVAGVAALAARVHLSIAVALLASLALIFSVALPVRRAVRIQSVPFEDLRTPARYVQAHRSSADVILLSSQSSWGFAYYWPGGHPRRVPTQTNLQGFFATLTDVPGLVQTPDRTDAGVLQTLRVALAQARGNGSASRIWLVREHLTREENHSWNKAFLALGVQATSVDDFRLVLLNWPR